MNRLKELRQEKKLSQKEIASQLQTPLRTYQRWENGESQIKPDKAQELADYFGVSSSVLLGYRDTTDSLGFRLWTLRNEKKLKVDEVAEKLQLSVDELKTIEKTDNGTLGPNLAKELADFYGVSVSFLLGYKEKPFDELKLLKGFDTIEELFIALKEYPEFHDYLYSEFNEAFLQNQIELGKSAFYRNQDEKGFDKLLSYLIDTRFQLTGDAEMFNLSKEINNPNSAVNNAKLGEIVDDFFSNLSTLPDLEQTLVASFITLSREDKYSVINIVKSLSAKK